MNVTIPDSHLDLLTGPVVAILATLMPDGRHQTSAIWRNYDGQYVWFITNRQTQKARNLLPSICVYPQIR